VKLFTKILRTGLATEDLPAAASAAPRSGGADRIDERDRLHRVKIVDPSFLNWPALARAVIDSIVPDFPLCNKSFNQSYSGNDL
jgi:hypothetical protein